MNKQHKRLIGLGIRYLSILILGLGNFYILQKILNPLTIHTTNIILKIFTNTILVIDTIYTSFLTIQIVPSCVATSAFYLLLFLIFSTSNIKPKTRLNATLTAVAIFFVLNITRILILIPIATTPYFTTVHWIFWHLVSTIFVLATWFATMKIHKIKSIPIHSDLKYLRSLTK
ncbi:pacearchaeosortase [Candidatus Pacearchaeota archaeon]|nr:pacearchaeosortase [Candidatus Pacearchaeota archaeon]